MAMELQAQRKCSRRRAAPIQLACILLFALCRRCSLESFQAAESHNVAPRRILDEAQNVGDSLEGSIGAQVPQDHRQCGSISKLPRQSRCDHARKYCKSGKSVVNYVILHYCTLDQRSWLSVPLLSGAVLLSFFWLAETAEKFFSPVAGLMVEMLKMSPTMGGVTLLALGNGAPDVFASMAAIGGGNSRIGLGAVISAGTFVSAFVVGSVTLVAAPFSVDPLPFVRDVLFYITAVGLVFWVYLKGVVTFWQSIGLMSFYVLFIAVVVVMDQVKAARKEQNQKYIDPPEEIDHSFVEAEHVELSVDSISKNETDNQELYGKETSSTVSGAKVKSILQAPLHMILRATIPEINPSRWNRFYSTANVILCPLLLLVMFRSVISLEYQVVFFHPAVQLPLWSLILVQNLFLALAFFISARQPEDAQFPIAFVAFVMSVFWISFIAGELLGCLAALGIVWGVSPALLGLTILAWGNSMGDLVADIAIARAGKPEMAIAGCFAGPMFNMLVGLGSALVLHTSYLQPAEYYLLYHPSIIIAFGFLFTGLLGSLLVVACSKFRVTKTWGFCLIGLYFIFTVVSLFTANGAH